MPQNRVTMRKIREILRLAWSCNQTRQSISDSCGIKGVSYTSIKSILNNNLDQKPLPKQQELLTVTHDNIRGTDYYG